MLFVYSYLAIQFILQTNITFKRQGAMYPSLSWIRKGSES